MFFVFIYFVSIHSTLETSSDKRDFANKIPWIHKQPVGVGGVKSQEKGEKLLVVHPGPWKVFTFFKCGKKKKNERKHEGRARHLVIRTPICLQGGGGVGGQKKDSLNICVCVR